MAAVELGQLEVMPMSMSLSQAASAMSLASMHPNGTLLLEFWHVRCTQCPAALQKISTLTSMFPSVHFVACAIATDARQDDAEAIAAIRELICDDYPQLEHVFLTFSQKETAKLMFGFTRVPHCAVVANGRVVFNGDPLRDTATLVQALTRHSSGP